MESENTTHYCGVQIDRIRGSPQSHGECVLLNFIKFVGFNDRRNSFSEKYVYVNRRREEFPQENENEPCLVQCVIQAVIPWIINDKLELISNFHLEFHRKQPGDTLNVRLYERGSNRTFCTWEIQTVDNAYGYTLSAGYTGDGAWSGQLVRPTKQE